MTLATQLDADGDLPGAAGVACFEWSTRDDFSNALRTPFQPATDKHDFIVRAELTCLKPNTTYHYRPVYGATEATTQNGLSCSFRTLPSGTIDTPVRFIVGSCMNYNKFMHGKLGNASGPLTATESDKRLGYPAFEAMLKLRPDLFLWARATSFITTTRSAWPRRSRSCENAGTSSFGFRR